MDPHCIPGIGNLVAIFVIGSSITWLSQHYNACNTKYYLLLLLSLLCVHDARMWVFWHRSEVNFVESAFFLPP